MDNNSFYAMAAAISILAGVGTALGQGYASAKGVEAIARQPDAGGKILTSMVLSLSMIETTGIYAFIIAILLVLKIK